MIHGVKVQVLRPGTPTKDRFNNEIPGEPTCEAVHNVLVSPGSTDELDASRPNGVQVAFTLHFPKTYTKSLEGCSVTLPKPWGGTYRVIGQPHPYIDANTPTAWHMPVEIEAAHG